MSDLGKMMAPLARRLGNMLARGSIAAVNGAGKMRTLQIRMMAGETKDNIEHFEPYGFSSEVLPGSEPIAAFFDGDRSHGVVLVVADRRYRLAGMRSGEVAIFDDLGQKVHLTRDGIVIDGAALPIKIQNTPSLTVDATAAITLNAPAVTVNASGSATITAPNATITASTKVQMTTPTLMASGDIYDRNGTRTLNDLWTQFLALESAYSAFHSAYTTHKHGGVTTGASNTLGPV